MNSALFTFLFLVHAALAAESYPATEEPLSPGQMEPTSVQSQAAPAAPSSKYSNRIAERPPARHARQEHTQDVNAAKYNAPSPETSPRNYDPVPASQAQPIVERLKIAEILVSKYGRAYDYRAFTLKELQQTLATLEGRIEATAPHAAAAPAAQQQTKTDDIKALPKPVELDANTDDAQATE